MNNMRFYNSFTFREFQIHHYRHNDVTVKPTISNYLCYVKMGGHGLFVSDDIRFEVYPGDLFYIPKDLYYHSYWWGSKNTVCFDSFGFKYLPVSEKTYPLQKISYDETVHMLLQKLSADKAVSPASVGLLYCVFGLLEHKMKNNLPNHQDSRIRQAIEYMNLHPEAQMCDVARHCGISESNLYLVFKKVLKKTPNTVRQEIRCKKAVDLLTTTDLSVEEISNRLDFSSSSYFRKIFGKVVGATPLEIRKKSHFV